MNPLSKQNVKPFFAFLGVFDFTLLAAAFTIFTETKSAIVDWVIAHVPIAQAAAEWILFIGINIVAIIGWTLIRPIWLERHNGTMKISIDDDSRGQRIEAFQSLRDHAKRSVMIMGIGMSSVSRDQSIVRLLQKGVNVNFLIMDPEILAKPSSPGDKMSKLFAETGILIDNQKFSSFYSKDDYCKIIEESIDNLRDLISGQSARRASYQGYWSEGRIEVRKYSYHVPMNVTVSDIDNIAESKLVAEFCLPFSPQRIRTKLSRGDVKELIIQQILALWNSAVVVMISE